MAKQTHMTLTERLQIQEGLDNKQSFKSIAQTLGRDCTTISKEVKAHKTSRQVGARGRKFNDCVHRDRCIQTGLCDDCNHHKRYRCISCEKNCSTLCPMYQRTTCNKLELPPYVCNGCSDRSQCTLAKVQYVAATAQDQYETVLTDSRTGRDITEQEVKRVDSLFSPLIKNGQSIHHIFTSHESEIMLSEKTIYNYVDDGMFEARNIDMPRKVRMRPRKDKKAYIKVDKSCRENRTYEDFKAFKEQHPGMPITELDSVEGVKGGAVLLTVHLVLPKLQLSFKRESNDAKSVADIFNNLYETLGPKDYGILFPLLLADNGSEFSDPLALEFAPDGTRRSYVFYCDPSQPGQKGSCENNHEMIRRVIPKGKDLSVYTDDQIDTMMNHINSYARESLANKSPYDMFVFYYGEELLKKPDVVRIGPDAVILKPSLLKPETPTLLV